jgi:GNAT superfamily N-acetyltransferase
MRSRTAAVAHTKAGSPKISTLKQEDLPEAAKILRLAFGTFFGVPDLETFWSDRDYAHGRHGAPHVASFAARLHGPLVGTAFATKWGSMGFFGPLSVHPDAQECGVARALLDRTMAEFDRWGTRHVGLFTFAQSAKHVGLYQKHGFYARFLTAIMAKPVTRAGANANSSRFRQLSEAHREEAVRACRKVTESISLTKSARRTRAASATRY